VLTSETSGCLEAPLALTAPPALLEALFVDSPDAIIAVDAQTLKLCLANPAATKLTGYSVDELLALDARDLDAEGPEQLQALATQIREEGSWYGRWRMRRKDGVVRMVALNASFTSVEGKSYLFGLVRDVTSRYEREERQRRQASLLATTLAHVGAASTPEAALEALIRGARDLIGGVSTMARAFDPVTAAGEISVTIGPDGELTVQRPPKPATPGSYTAAMQAGGPSLIVEDFHALDPETYPLYEHMAVRGIRSTLNVPIDVGGRRVGSLHLDHSEPGYYSTADLALAEALASRAGAAIERTRLEEGRAAQAKMDGALLVARTVAHEINNALAPVAGYADLLATRPGVKADSQATLFVEFIASGAQDIARKIARLQRIVRLREDASPLGPRMPVLDIEGSTDPGSQDPAAPGASRRH
jgi:PAS domain S-box-containing protein